MTIVNQIVCVAHDMKTHAFMGFLAGFVYFSSANCAQTAVTFVGGSENADAGGSVTVSITVMDFVELYSAQYSVAWDPLVLQYTSSLINPELGAFTGINATELSEAKLGYFWLAANALGENETYPNGTVLLRITFDVIGTPGSSSAIYFTDDPLGREVQNVEGPVGPVTWQNGNVAVNANLQPRCVSIENNPGGEYRIVFAGAPDTTYTIQVVENLGATNWSALGQRTSDSGGDFEFTDTPPPDVKSRFYRAAFP